MSNTNNPTWIHVPEDSDFPIQNIPFGIFKTAHLKPRIGTRIGDTVLDLTVLHKNDFFKAWSLDPSVFENSYLNAFISQGKSITNAIRNQIIQLFSEDAVERTLLQNLPGLTYAADEVEMLLPVQIGDYTDFYSSIEHATNVGKMFRDPNNALLPNWKHIPVGYHGRASSIVVSGSAIHRPKGQILLKDAEQPIFSPSKLMDFELEMGYIIGKPTALGSSISVEKASEYVFGMCIFNDLTARDIQKWEYVPLGPFLGKNFGSVISPWIVTMEALEAFKVAGPKQEPEVLPYLQFEGKQNYDIHLEVFLQPQDAVASLICQSNHKHLYWNIPQQLAHHTVNGCNINVGDLYASGTISGPDESSFGSLLELSWSGQKEIKLQDGSNRKFIEDYDTIIMKAYAEANGVRIGFGTCITQILPAL
jgi:fumarylacetoacetase